MEETVLLCFKVVFFLAHVIDSYARIFSLHMWATVSVSYDPRSLSTVSQKFGKWFTVPPGKKCPYACAEALGKAGLNVMTNGVRADWLFCGPGFKASWREMWRTRFTSLFRRPPLYPRNAR